MKNHILSNQNIFEQMEMFIDFKKQNQMFKLFKKKIEQLINTITLFNIK